MDDDKIIDLYWERSEKAISETSKKYSRYLRAIASNILSNHLDAEECENDTYIAAWNAMPSARPNRLLAFLGRITRNIALDRYDYNTAKKRNNEFDILLSELEDFVSTSTDVETQFENGELSKIISSFLRTINSEYRIISIRRYWYTDSIKSISLQLGMSESKVKSILFRTRNNLKTYLEKEGIVL